MKDAMLVKLSNEALNIKREHFLAMRDQERRNKLSMMETRDEVETISDSIS